ncbi:MAG: hypothetical protein LBV40_04260 [Methanomicrobiales archaeon]|jgi:hypothetical protein|nr:hypothetical protein [Methanomicrobiales archaeon]
MKHLTPIEKKRERVEQVRSLVVEDTAQGVWMEFPITVERAGIISK